MGYGCLLHVLTGSIKPCATLSSLFWRCHVQALAGHLELAAPQLRPRQLVQVLLAYTKYAVAVPNLVSAVAAAAERQLGFLHVRALPDSPPACPLGHHHPRCTSAEPRVAFDHLWQPISGSCVLALLFAASSQHPSCGYWCSAWLKWHWMHQWT